MLAVGAAERGRPVIASPLHRRCRSHVRRAYMLSPSPGAASRRAFVAGGRRLPVPASCQLRYGRLCQSIGRSPCGRRPDDGTICRIRLETPIAGWRSQARMTRANVSSLASCVAFCAQAAWIVIELVRRDGRSPCACRRFVPTSRAHNDQTRLEGSLRRLHPRFPPAQHRRQRSASPSAARMVGNHRRGKPGRCLRSGCCLWLIGLEACIITCLSYGEIRRLI